MEITKRFEFLLSDLTEEAQARFIQFLGGDDGNHDVIPFCVYDSICDEENCGDCELECDKNTE
jgi:hypothetical protein